MTIKQQGGIFGRNPTFNDLTVDGSISVPADSISGDAINGGTATPSGLAVDTSTLVVDAINNRVGIGTTSPLTLLHATLPSGVNGDIVSLGRAANSYQFKLGMTSGSMFYVGDNSSNILIGFPYTGGITFNGDTAAANALNDYEEGTWTPTYVASTTNPTFSSYGLQTGYYTKVGELVYVSARLRTNGYNSDGAGNLRIGGLPYASASIATLGSGGAISILGSLSFTSNPAAGYFISGGSYIQLNSNTLFTAATVSALDTGTADNDISFFGVYRAS